MPPPFAVVDRRRVDERGNARPGQEVGPRCRQMFDTLRCLEPAGHRGAHWYFFPAVGRRVHVDAGVC